VNNIDGIFVRPIDLRDIGGFSECVTAVVAERVYLAHIEPLPIDETAKFVALNIRVGNPQFVAEDDGRIVGWCDIVRSSVPVQRHCGSLGIGMLAAYRGRGLGLRLIETTVAAARAAGFERVDRVVYGRNERAAALYHKAGFVEIGRRTRAKKLDGEYDDTILMGMLLAQAPT
jgi:RimJ/RimL family protein N-acetyltransferase